MVEDGEFEIQAAIANPANLRQFVPAQPEIRTEYLAMMWKGAGQPTELMEIELMTMEDPAHNALRVNGTRILENWSAGRAEQVAHAAIGGFAASSSSGKFGSG